MKRLPPGWIKTSIGAIADLANGRAFKPADWGKEGLPIIRIQNLNRPDIGFNHFSGEVDERHLVNAGDLLFAWSGTPGTSFGAHIWRGSKAVLNQHIFNVRVDPHTVDREFLKEAINHTLDQQIAKAHGGAGLRHVTKAAFEATSIALPPFAEQRRIVERLKSYTSRTTDIGRSLSEATVAVEQGRAALLASAFDLTFNQGVSRNAPTDRNMSSVGDLALNIAYGSSAKSAPSGRVAVLRMGNIQKGKLDWTDLVFTSDEREINRFLLEPGDVLFNRTNGSPQLVGKTAVYNGEMPAIHAGYLIRIRCSQRVLPDYLSYCLNSPAGREYCMSVRTDSAGQSNINSKKLAAFRLPCPSIGEQQIVVDMVRSGMRRLDIIEIAVQIAHEMLSEISSRLTEEALLGNLGTGLSSDEPAKVQSYKLMSSNLEPKVRHHRIRTGAPSMRPSVYEILEKENGPISAQVAAERYGIKEGAGPEEVEPFYAELRALDNAGRLTFDALFNEAGAKLGERVQLKVKS